MANFIGTYLQLSVPRTHQKYAIIRVLHHRKHPIFFTKINRSLCNCAFGVYCKNRTTNVTSLSIQWRHSCCLKVWINSLLTSAPDRREWSTWRSGRFTPGTQLTGGCVSPRPGLDVSAKRKNSCPWLESNTESSSTWPGHYIDCAISGPKCVKLISSRSKGKVFPLQA